MTAQCATQGTALQAQAQQLQHELQKMMRRFGRQCRGMGNVFVTLVRQTERQLLEIGDQVRPLAQAAHAYLHGAPQLCEDQRERLDSQLMAALAVQQRIEHQSRQLTQGKALPHCKIVNAYDPTIAPICKGKSNCPAQFGRKPGIIAEPAAGFIFGLHLPVGNPSDVSYVQPLIDKVQQTIARLSTYPRPTIHSLAGDLAFNDASLREALHQQGILTVGIPHTVEPLPSAPTPEDVLGLLSEGGLPRARTSCQVHLAYACGYSRPVVESIIASLLGRGAARITYKGHRGASVQMGMAVMAHNAATLVRIHEYRLSKRARKFRRRLRLRCRKVSQFNASIN
jgi:Transposase DDE domain